MKLPKHYNPTNVESNVKQYWSENSTYEQVKESNKNGDDFYFVDGPPFTSGRMHCGTAWGKVLKDVLLRYQRMKGRNVIARPGYDTHGLPIEVKVEQEYGLDSKQEIEELGVNEFINKCRQYVHDQKSVMDDEFSDLGVWMDWDNPYLTMNKEYMETVWSAFYRLYNQDRIGQGQDVLNVCPRCETSLSDSELEYDDRTITATYMGFDLINRDGTMVAWTTTPWTIVGHQFLAVDKDLLYSKVDSSSERYYVASECVEDTMEAMEVDSYEVIDEVHGSELVGSEYRNPMEKHVDGLPDVEFSVRHADYVEANKTGVVHSAPGFGMEDYERGTSLGLSPFSPVSETGEFTEKAGSRFKGKYVHSQGTEEAISALKQEDMLVGTEEHTHEYPHCPRCDTNVVFRATDQWMVKVTDMKQDLQDAIDDTSWFPSEAKDGRFRNTVKNAPDWNISRQRYWGTPIPVWRCSECEEGTVVRSADHLESLSYDDLGSLEDLHRSSVDDVTVECQACGGKAHRVEDVLDVWFDSSVASWASLGVRPHENPNPEPWPANLVVEGHDQTRGWFLMQLYQGVGLEGSAPYENVLMHGFALLDGEPMSKSRGHVLRPPEVIEEHGRDALRSYMLSNEQQENDVNMTSDMQEVSNMKQSLDIVWNTYRFGLMYMNEDEYTISEQLKTDKSERKTLDNWILSRLDATIEEAEDGFNNQQPHRALQSTIDLLIEDLSRYYIKTIRDRVWMAEDTKDKAAAYDTLGTVLHAGVRLLAPFAPHLSEKLYSSLPTGDREESVHIESWPETNEVRNSRLETDISLLQDVEQAVSRARDKIGRKRRWQVASFTVETSDQELYDALERHRNHLLERTNSGGLQLTDNYDGSTFLVEPDMSEFGPAFQSDASVVAERVRDRQYSNLPFSVSAGERNYTVDEDMVNKVENLNDSVVQVDMDRGAVYVDRTLSEEIVVRGTMRDLVRELQDMRSELNLDMDQEVLVSINSDSDDVKSAVSRHREYIKNEVRIRSLESVDDPDLKKKVDINGDQVNVGIKT